MESEYCMKCGRELKPGTVFCEGCLAEMEKYPVKPGVVVLLPHRPAQNPKNPGRRKHPVVPLEEQVARLKKRLRDTIIALVLALAALAGTGWFAVTQYLENQEEGLLPGQNYSSESSDQTEQKD